MVKNQVIDFYKQVLGWILTLLLASPGLAVVVVVGTYVAKGAWSIIQWVW